MRHFHWLLPVLSVPMLAFGSTSRAPVDPVEDRSVAGYFRAESGAPSWASGFFDDWNLGVVGHGTTLPSGFFGGGGRVEGQLLVRPGAGSHFDLSDLLGILFFSRGSSSLDSWFLFLAFQAGGNPAQFFWGRIGSADDDGNPGGPPGNGNGGGIAVPEPGTWLMLVMLLGMSTMVMRTRMREAHVISDTR